MTGTRKKNQLMKQITLSICSVMMIFWVLGYRSDFWKDGYEYKDVPYWHPRVDWNNIHPARDTNNFPCICHNCHKPYSNICFWFI